MNTIVIGQVNITLCASNAREKTEVTPLNVT